MVLVVWSHTHPGNIVPNMSTQVTTVNRSRYKLHSVNVSNTNQYRYQYPRRSIPHVQTLMKDRTHH